MSPEVLVLAEAAQILGMLVVASGARGKWRMAYLLIVLGWGLIWFVMKVSGVTV